MRDRLATALFFFAIFLLPWQTRFLIRTSSINGQSSEYGSLSLYLVEVLLLIVLVLRGSPRLHPALRFVVQAFYFFLAAIFFSLGFTSFFEIGLFHLISFLFALTFFVLLCDERTQIKPVCVAFLVGLLFPSVLGWFQTLTGFSPASSWLGLAEQHSAVPGTAVVETETGRLMRAYGTFSHPNIFGGYLAIGILLMGYLVRFIRSQRARVLFAIPLILLSATLIITFSRSAWLALTISFLILITLMLYRKRMLPRQAVPLIILGAITLLSTSFVFHPQLFSRFEPTSRLEQISLNERSSQYQTFTDVLRLNPFFGVGPGAYPFALAVVKTEEPVWAYQPVHNALLLLLAELGVLGIIAFLYLVFRVDQVSVRAAQRADGMFAVSLSILLLVLAFFDHYLWSLWSGLALSIFAFACVLKWTIPPS